MAKLLIFSMSEKTKSQKVLSTVTESDYSKKVDVYKQLVTKELAYMRFCMLRMKAIRI